MRVSMIIFALVALVAGCSDPVDTARSVLTARYPVGSSSDGLADTFKARRYRPVVCPADPTVALKTLGCGHPVGMNSRLGTGPVYRENEEARPPGIPTCMVRPEHYFMASGFIVCWVTASDKSIVWTYADWYVGNVPRLAE
jgi:hypothetical protein